MRLSENILVQQVDDNTIVIMDDTTAEEIEISKEVAVLLVPAIQYFFPHLFVDITPAASEVPT